MGTIVVMVLIRARGRSRVLSVTISRERQIIASEELLCQFTIQSVVPSREAEGGERKAVIPRTKSTGSKEDVICAQFLRVTTWSE